MADMQAPQSPQQGVQQVKIISSGVGGSGTRPLQMMSNVADGGPAPTPIILNASPVGVQIQSSSTPVMLQSSSAAGGTQSPSVGGGVTILSGGGSATAGSTSPPPAAAASITPGSVTIRSATSAPQQPPAYNGPAAVGQTSVVQPRPISITPSPAPQSAVTTSSGVVRLDAGGSTSPQTTYGPPQTTNQPSAVTTQPVTRVDRPATTAPPAKPRLTANELLSKADPLWVCGFILAVVAVAFATMVFEDEVPTTWLLLFVSVASVGAFVKLQL